MERKEELGFVTSRSGSLIVIDTGYLGIWSNNQPPMLPEGDLESAEALQKANSFIDLHIVGAHAELAGQMLEMSCHPLYVFDQPRDHQELQSKLVELTQNHDLDARFEVISPRIPHRKRVDLALEQNGAGEIQFHGVPAVAVKDVPISQRLRVMGERMPPQEQDRWRRVLIECRPQIPISQSEKIGYVGVDYARLLIADVDALGAWQHERSLDGMADFLFWGRDADQLAEKFSAPLIHKNEFGWINLPEHEAAERGFAIEQYCEGSGLKLATDFRPHSHHWQVMTPTRKSPTESGMAEIAGVTVCNFMTTWGDGLFEVHRDLSAAGELVQLRIELAHV